MTQSQNMPAGLKPIRSSHGLKLIIVCALVLLMAIPAMFISFISFERSGRADDVTREVSERYGGSQYVTGPVLSIPYHVIKGTAVVESGDYIIFPETGRADFSDVDVTVKKRSLFKVPVYTAKGEISAQFKKLDREKLERGRIMDWDRARLLVGITDGRGLKEDVFLKTSNGSLKFEPAFFDNSVSPVLNEYYFHKNHQNLNRFDQRGSSTYLAIPAADLLWTDQLSNVSAKINLGGATHLAVYPFAKSTTVIMKSNWASPGFQGAFPPTDREILADGFTANWSVPYLARGIIGEGPAQTINMQGQSSSAMTVQFVSELNPYRTVNRSLKYAVMFIGLVFIAFFLFEVLVGRPVHPAQYILIGLAQSIFYLLLLAFSEHIGFSLAFAVSAGATVILTALYAGWTFGERIYAVRAGIVFALTYGLLYSLMRMQDFALMIGALASFMAIALVMYLTRNMDWYGKKADLTHSPSGPLPRDIESRI